MRWVVLEGGAHEGHHVTVNHVVVTDLTHPLEPAASRPARRQDGAVESVDPRLAESFLPRRNGRASFAAVGISGASGCSRRSDTEARTLVGARPDERRAFARLIAIAAD